MKFKLRSRTIAGIALLAASVATAFAQTTIEFNSMNRKQGFPAILEHRAQYTDKVSGVFTRPTNATGNVPVMVIMHSSGGINDTTWEWSKFFLDMGVATFVVDSFKPRGIDSSTYDQSQLNYGASLADSLLALKVVSEQPGVDPKRIGVIGFSRGALAAASSSFENLRSAVLGKDSVLKFALHIPYYGGCTQVGTTTGSPMLYFVGKEDDFVSADSCTLAVKKMREKGANIADYVLYPNTYHSFDVERPKRLYIGLAQSFKNCVISQDLDDLAYYADGKQVTSKEYGDYFGKCQTKGSTVDVNSQAKSDSRAKTKTFVIKTFGL
jgi:dienelactone hydrolase